MSPISRFVTHFLGPYIWKILHYDGKKMGAKDKGCGNYRGYRLLIIEYIIYYFFLFILFNSFFSLRRENKRKKEGDERVRQPKIRTIIAMVFI